MSVASMRSVTMAAETVFLLLMATGTRGNRWPRNDVRQQR